MNEESKLLKALDTMYGIALEGVLPNEERRLDECYNILEEALEHYVKGLEASETYVHRDAKDALFNLEVLAMKNTHKDFWKLPEQLAEDIKKELTVIDIIKRELKYNIDFADASDFRAYIDGMICCENKEEFDLLKGVLLS